MFVILAMLQTAVFAQNLQDKWTVEAESPDTRVVLQSDGVIDMLSPKGLTLWYNERMSGDVVIEYDAQVVNNGADGERTSDLTASGWRKTRRIRITSSSVLNGAAACS